MPASISRSKILPRLGCLGVLAGIAAGLVYAFQPQPALVDFAQVTRAPLQVTVSEDGVTRIQERFVVASPLAGRLLRIRLNPGDELVAGQTLLAAIEPVDPTLLDARALAESDAREKAAHARTKQADELVTKAKTELDYYENELARIAKLTEQGPKTRTDLERAQLAYRTATQDYASVQFAKEVAEFEWQMAKAAQLQTQPAELSNLPEGRNFPIYSPIAGRVLRVFQESSRVIAPGENLLEIGDPTDLEVVVDVLSSDAVQIERGAAVSLERWGGSKPLRGRVRVIEPSGFTKISALGVEEQRVNIVIDFVDPPSERGQLGDGFRVEADIVLWEGEDVLQVPTSALFRDEGNWSVFVVESGRARRRRVELGRRNGLQAEILNGLTEGETVIVHPGDSVRDEGLVNQRPTGR